MASLTLTDAYVSINSVDLSDHVQSVEIAYSSEMLDETAMGDTTKKNKGGLKDWSMKIDFKQDYAASKVDATLFPLVGSTFTVIVRPVNTGGVSSTNPNFTGTGILESYNPVGGKVGELSSASISIKPAGSLSRAVA